MRRPPTLRHLAAALTLIVAAGAPSPAVAAWQSYSTAQGLASNSVTAVLADRSGAVWFGTSGGGLSRYDGASWKTFRAVDGLLSDQVTAIAQDSSGVMWFGTDRGASRYDGASWQSFSAVGGVIADPIRAIFVDRTNRVWFGTALAGVAMFDGTAWTSFTTLQGLATNRVFSVAQDGNGEVWLGHDTGLSHFNGTSWTTVYNSPIPTPLSGSIAFDRRGTMWISNGTALTTFGNNTWHLVSPSERGVPATASGTATTPNLYVDGDDDVWVIEPGLGVSRFDGRGWQYFSRLFSDARDLLPSGDVTAVAQGLDGNVWIGTALDGGARFDLSTARTIELNYADTYNKCLGCGLADHLGNVWFAKSDSLRRFDGSGWKYYPLGGGSIVASTLEDRSGSLWFGGAIFNPVTLTASASPLAGVSLLQDRLGQMWAGGGSGVYRWNGSVVERYYSGNTSGVLAGDHVTSLVEDSAGLLWIAVTGGLATFDGSEWRSLRPPSSDPSRVDVLKRDHLGRLWIASPAGLERLDGASWTAIPRDIGIPPSQINSLFEDRDGNLWMGTSDQGVFRFNGDQWGQYSTVDGLTETTVEGIVQDSTGTIWFEHPARLTRYFPDRRPPRTMLTLRPPALSSSRAQTATFAGEWSEGGGILFSTSFDGEPWSPWSSATNWSASDLADGPHSLRVRSRDRIGNVEPTPANATFEIDASPPIARLDAPASRAVVHDSIVVTGAAADARIREYRVEMRAAGITDWDPAHVTLLGRGTSSVPGGTLAGWNTRNTPDGGYDLHLVLADTLGLSTSIVVTVTVDNRFPSDDHTSPALVRELTGGDVYTTHAETHLYFPPHAFAEDAEVTMQSIPPDSVPPTLPDGASRALAGFAMSWSSPLLKAARYEISTAGITGGTSALAIYFSSAGSAWARLGGTFEPGAGQLTLDVTQPGRYAVFADGGASSGAPGLGPLTFTPRVFSPNGRFSDPEVGIGFALGRAAEVTVRVYSVSGRLIRSITENQSMGSGQNLVRWDGRDREGAGTIDGMYIVTVQALGRTEKKTLAVVR